MTATLTSWLPAFDDHHHHHHRHHHHPRLRQVAPFVLVIFAVPLSCRPWMELATGAAMRRRQRRLRSWLRHERMTVAMALAESVRTTPQGVRSMPGAGFGEHEQHYTAETRKPPTPQPELFSLEEEPGGGLPAPLSEVAGRQDKVVRHVVEDLVSLHRWCRSSIFLCRRRWTT